MSNQCTTSSSSSSSSRSSSGSSRSSSSFSSTKTMYYISVYSCDTMFIIAIIISIVTGPGQAGQRQGQGGRGSNCPHASLQHGGQHISGKDEKVQTIKKKLHATACGSMPGRILASSSGLRTESTDRAVRCPRCMHTWHCM